jgi:acyl-coenzyme A thioesterase PaaI-like protein
MSQPQETQEERWQRQARHWESGVRFNKASGARVRHWDADKVVMEFPHTEWLCNSTDGFHGGAVAALADTCRTGASLAASGAEGFIATKAGAGTLVGETALSLKEAKPLPASD